MPVAPDPLPVDWVSSEIMRQRFNDAHLYELAQAGQVLVYTKRSSHPDTPPAGEPVCTHSQILYYYSQEGSLLAVVHQHLRADGTIGASGRPDPKRLVLENRIMSVRTEPPLDPIPDE